MLAQIQLQGPSKQFQQHLKARLGYGRVIPALAEFIPDKSIYVVVSRALPISSDGSWKYSLYIYAILTLGPGNLIETKENTLIMQGLADQITALWRDVVVVFTEDLGQDIPCQSPGSFHRPKHTKSKDEVYTHHQ